MIEQEGGTVGRNNRRLLCHNCGAVYKDIWDPQIGGTQCPSCPYCGAGWFSNTLKNYRPPLKHRFRRFSTSEELSDLEIQKLYGIILDGTLVEEGEEVEICQR